MKTTFIITVFSSVIVFAQNPRTAVTNAAMSLEVYLSDPSKSDELVKAKNDIDFAAKSDATKDDPKVWRYRGNIHNKIAFDPNLESSIKENAGLIAFESYSKAWNLEKAKLEEKGKDITKIPSKSEFKEGFETASRAMYNLGAESFNVQDYSKAFQCYSSIMKIKPLTDLGLGKKGISLITSNEINMEIESQRLAGLASIEMGNPEKGEDLLMPLMKNGKIKDELIPSIYRSLAISYVKSGKNDKAKLILAEGRKSYPEDQNLLIEEINIALLEGNLASMEDKLQQAVEGDKDNAELRFVLGNVYDEIFRGKLEENAADAESFFNKSVDWYKSALEKDEKHFNSAYSIGAIHVNYSNSFAKQMNEIVDMKDPKLKELEKTYNDLLDRGLVYLLMAEEMKSESLDVVIALKEVYSRKNDENNYTKYKNKESELRNK